MGEYQDGASLPDKCFVAFVKNKKMFFRRHSVVIFVLFAGLIKTRGNEFLS